VRRYRQRARTGALIGPMVMRRTRGITGMASPILRVRRQPRSWRRGSAMKTSAEMRQQPVSRRGAAIFESRFLSVPRAASIRRFPSRATPARGSAHSTLFRHIPYSEACVSFLMHLSIAFLAVAPAHANAFNPKGSSPARITPRNRQRIHERILRGGRFLNGFEKAKSNV